MSSNKTALSLTILSLLAYCLNQKFWKQTQHQPETSPCFTSLDFCLQFCVCTNVRKIVDMCVCVCVCVCVWRRGGWVGVHTHVHARKPTTVHRVKDTVTNEYASFIQLEIYETG